MSYPLVSCMTLDLKNIKLMKCVVFLLVLINNAASLQMPKTQDLVELKDLSNSNFNNCVTSNILVTKAFIPILRKSSWPRVIMTSSARGSLGRTASREVRVFSLPLSFFFWPEYESRQLFGATAC